MILKELIDLLDYDPHIGTNPKKYPIDIISIDSGEVLYADLIENIPDDLANSTLESVMLPSEAEDLVLTVLVSGVPYNEADDGMYGSTNIDKNSYIKASKTSKYRVWAYMTSWCYLDVNASDEYEAEEIAEDEGGGAFTVDEKTGSWEIDRVEKLD